MDRLLLPIVWLAWGLSYPLMAWSLEAVDLFSGRLILMPFSGLILLGIGAVLTKRMGMRGDVTINAARQILLGAVPVVGVWLFYSHNAYFHPENVRGLFALAWLALISNVLAYACWFRVIRALPASIASLTTMIVPCIGFAS